MGLDAADVAYLHKLKKSKRDKRLIAAFLLLLYALRRLRPGASRPEIETELAPIVGALGAGIAGYVAKQTQTSATTARRKAIAVPLLAAIALHVAHAQQLEAAARDERLGLIARSELQQATAAATKRAAAGKHTLTRETTSAQPCEQCADLAGTYDEPWPDDVFYSHPNCCCSWNVDDGTEAA